VRSTVKKPCWLRTRPAPRQVGQPTGSLPDSLPAIGRSRPSPHILYAFGHGHLGLTQSAATGKLIAELVTGATPSLDLTPFSPQRF